MSTEGCQPVSCDDHDLLEEASMHRKLVELEFELDGVTQKESGTIADVYTADGAEFVKLVAPNGPLEIRLDPIISMRPG